VKNCAGLKYYIRIDVELNQATLNVKLGNKYSMTLLEDDLRVDGSSR